MNFVSVQNYWITQSDIEIYNLFFKEILSDKNHSLLGFFGYVVLFFFFFFIFPLW